MADRLDLQAMLEKLLGSHNVYYQPPESIKMSYPAIVYSRENIENKHADDNVYMQKYFYKVTVIDDDPDSEIVSKVSKIPTCRFNRHYTADNLNHDTFILYY